MNSLDKMEDYDRLAKVCEKLANELKVEREKVAKLQLSRLDKECLRIGREIQRAADELPEMYAIEIAIEQGSGCVSMYDEDGNKFDYDNDADGLSYTITKAVNSAIAKQKEVN